MPFVKVMRTSLQLSMQTKETKKTDRSILLGKDNFRFEEEPRGEKLESLLAFI